MDGSSTIKFSFVFLYSYWQFNHTRVGGGLPTVHGGGGGSLMSHSTGSVTAQSIGFNYVMVPEPYRYTWYLKQVTAGLQYVLKR